MGMFWGLSFLLLVGLLVHHRHTQRWRGEPLEITGIDAQYRERKVTSHDQDSGVVFHHRLELGIPGVKALDLTLKRERWWDRLFRRLGVIVECQTGRPDLDSRLHILSDSSAACRMLKTQPELLDRFEQVLQRCRRRAVGFRALHLRQRRIWVQLDPQGAGPHDAHIQLLFSELVPLLDEIRQALETYMATASPQALKDRSAGRAAIFLGTSSALIFGGTAAIIAMAMTHHGNIDQGVISGHAWQVAWAVIATLLAAALLVLRRSSRLHLVALELLLVGLPGATLLAGAGLNYANAAWDRGETQWHRVAIVAKEQASWGRGRMFPARTLVLEEWMGRDDWSLKVDKATFEDFDPSRHRRYALLEVSPGRFGVRWVKQKRLEE
ncbi:hypothetical protein SAMN04487957_10756 [Halomonas shengliensis]|uniref:Uncharacterized protein n=1 Tax=Halomonas shengliensis TaxID=419597 RepID=A0A1H0K3E7_9GAMM|nr:hypothetical protein [Halomonas shengliensis]SDO50394.1 hypothetical protein SAMN04487957_10756 [Halomonas shengliensis]